MDADRWERILRECRLDADLCGALAEFLSANNVVIETYQLLDGRERYDVRFDRQRVADVERAGSRHWVVKER